MNDKQKVSAETIIRTIVLAITLINSVLTILGKNPLPFAEEDIYTALTAASTIAATIWAWWKNNSFTSEAIQADEFFNELKSGNVTNNNESEE